jgi:hypothetical protein
VLVESLHVERDPQVVQITDDGQLVDEIPKQLNHTSQLTHATHVNSS